MSGGGDFRDFLQLLWKFVQWLIDFTLNVICTGFFLPVIFAPWRWVLAARAMVDVGIQAIRVTSAGCA
jgi:hypothetical protein